MAFPPGFCLSQSVSSLHVFLWSLFYDQEEKFPRNAEQIGDVNDKYELYLDDYDMILVSNL